MDKSAIRRHIITTAYQEVLAGSHYLTGCDGGYPQSGGGGAGGLKNRKIDLMNVKAADSIAIQTAKYSGRLCLGRYEAAPAGYELNIGKKEHLYQYLEQYCPEASWQYGMTPRSLNWTTVLIGESCQYKRHFDCIFFVNWVLTKALQKPKGVSYNINQWANPSVAPIKVLEIDAKNPTGILDADIFVNVNSSPQHIGFLCAGGHTIHASGASVGVVAGAWKISKYSHIVRLKDHFLDFG